MKCNELIWRNIADSALTGHRWWGSVGEIAEAAGVPSRTGYLATEKLLEVGAVEQRSRGAAITNPE